MPTRTVLPSLDHEVKVINYYRALDDTSRDKHTAKSITVIIAALHGEGHQGPLEQGFIDNRLHGTDVSEFIHVLYGSLVKFLHDFVVTISNKGTFFIDHVPLLVLSRPVRVSPADSMSLDSDSAELMCLSLNRWGFPYPVRHLQIYHKYKGEGVPFPPDFGGATVTLLLGSLSEHEDIVPHGVLKDTSVRNRGAHLFLTMQHSLLSYHRRIKTCLRSYER